MNEQSQQPATNNDNRTTSAATSSPTATAAAASASAENPSATTTTPPANPPHAKPSAARSSFDLPLPEDRSAIQASIGIILQRIATNDLDPRRAGLLLYGLQIASLNLPKQQQRDEEAARTSPRNHHPPRTRHPRPTNRDPRKEELHRTPPRRTHQTKTRSPTPNPGHRRHFYDENPSLRSETRICGGRKVVLGELWRFTHLSDDETIAKMGRPAIWAGWGLRWWVG